MKTIKDGNVDDITDKLTPRALTKCHTNALMMAMKVSKMAWSRGGGGGRQLPGILHIRKCWSNECVLFQMPTSLFYFYSILSRPVPVKSINV